MSYHVKMTAILAAKFKVYFIVNKAKGAKLKAKN